MAKYPVPPPKTAVSPVLIIVLGLLFLFAAIVVGLIIFYKNCETCQQVVEGISEGTTAIVQGMSAPGTAEMRGLGCDQAMAVNMEVFQTMLGPMIGQEQVLDDDMRSMKMLLCQQQGFGMPQGPECADVIRAWASGAGEQPRNEALVVVQGQADDSNYCQGIYALDGTLVADLAGEF